MGKVWATKHMVSALVFAKMGTRAKCGEPINWFSAQPLKFHPKLSEAAFSAVFPNFEKCQHEVADDVISYVAVD